MPVKKKPTKEDIAKKILAMEAARDRGKNNYAKSSKLFDELLQTLKPGDKVKLPDGRTFTVVDPFVRPDGTLKKVWKPAGIARYDWEISQD